MYVQDKEVGDGTTSVVLLASELLRLSVQLIKDDLHPTAVIAGYRLAMKVSSHYALLDRQIIGVQSVASTCPTVLALAIV